MALALKTAVPPAQPDSAPDRISVPFAAPDFRAVRTSLCETRPLRLPLASSDQDLVVELCQMPFDLSAPLLRSRLRSLSQDSLLALIAATGEAHHLLIAAQPSLDRRVIKALLKGNHPRVALKLAQSETLVFDQDAAHRLAQLARCDTELAQAITSNPALSLARGILKSTPEDAIGYSNLKMLRLLRAGAESAFVLEAAKRLGFEPTAVARLLSGTSVMPFALILCALGIDRSVFVDLLHHWQGAREGYFSPADAPASGVR